MSLRIESQTEPIAGYRLLDRLGSGGFGEVWRCEAPGGIYKAVKIIHGDLRNRENDTYRFAEQELKALNRVKSVRHPYLLALDRFDIIDGRLMIVMELADRNLWDRFRECRKQGLPGIPRGELLRYMAETAEVLDLFNDEFQLQHLDIKPQNLFLLYGHVKVADFGQVKDLEGLMAQVTGGITPVYAAPETFDGFVSRYCDQYSLACVYQELLTGIRPFDGTSMQQLLMQHLQQEPNLHPSPSTDRPALSRALAKKPEDRFPSVSAMVAMLRGGNATPAPFPVSTSSAAAAVIAALGSTADTTSTAGRDPSGTHVPAVAPLPQTGSGNIPAPDSTPPPRAVTDTLPPGLPAPPEVTGPGSLRPALVIGLGYSGLRVLQRFRKMVGDRIGSLEKTPLVRVLYLDTDPDAITAATVDQPWAGLAGLRSEDVVPTRLNRPAHYLKPRLSGRTLIDNWFDSQLLYRLPRTPVTMGHRVFGRLAFCDHYRAIVQRLQTELAACLDPNAAAATEATTGLAPRTNRPRVYIVAGIGGGTGGGMFLDLAYTIRAQLKALGYTDPDVVGVLLLPPDGQAGEVGPLAQANAYAALTELHHYSHSGSVYIANHDGWDGTIRDTGPPFRQTLVVPGLPHPPQPVQAGSGSAVIPQPIRSSGTVSTSAPRGTGTVRVPAIRQTGTWGPDFVRRQPDLDSPERDPSTVAAEFLRLDLFSPVGRTVDDRRTLNSPDGVSVRTLGVSKFAWPRAEVVARAARVIAPVLMGHWLAPDPIHIRQVIPGWTTDLWTRIGLDPDKLTARLTEAADRAFRAKVSDDLARVAESLAPKGWLARLPDPDTVARALTRWQEMLGRPQGAVIRSPLPIEKALSDAGEAAALSARSELGGIFPGLIETPQFRLAGTEEALRQILAMLDRTKEAFEKQVKELETLASDAFDQLVTHANYQKGIRKLTAVEFADAVRQFPTARYQMLVKQAAIAAYRTVRAFLTERLADVAACRARLDVYRPMLKAEAQVPASPANPGDLLPPQCTSTEDAAQMFLRSLTDDDLSELDERIQAGLEREYGGLYQACLNSVDGPDSMLRLLREESRSYLDARLGEVDLTAMLARVIGTGESATRGLRVAFDRAFPALAGNGPWAKNGIAVLAAPTGAGGDPIRALAANALPQGVATTTLADEVVFYRECPEVPLSALPQLGPAWAAAYRAAPEAHQVTPHTRTDVTQWIDVDAD